MYRNKNTRLVFKDVEDVPHESRSMTKSVSRIERLPTVFESVHTWPRKCELRCWGCHQQFDTVPLFIVKSLESNYTTITPYGVFCSKQCGVFWIMTNASNINERQNMLMNFEAVLKKMIAGPVFSRAAYIPYYDTEQYGGHVPMYVFYATLNKFRITEDQLLI